MDSNSSSAYKASLKKSKKIRELNIKKLRDFKNMQNDRIQVIQVTHLDDLVEDTVEDPFEYEEVWDEYSNEWDELGDPWADWDEYEYDQDEYYWDDDAERRRARDERDEKIIELASKINYLTESYYFYDGDIRVKNEMDELEEELNLLLKEQKRIMKLG